MIIGNGYTKGHAEVALDILRNSPVIRRLYETVYT
jgi:L-erythro-3,5-diaminohexanoate dehydrogenase